MPLVGLFRTLQAPCFWITVVQVDHSGAGRGAASDVGLLPERKSVVVVLANDMAPAPVIADHLLARMIQGSAAADWIGEAAARRTRRQEQPAVEQLAAVPLATAARPFVSYGGTYRDPWYADITVKERGSSLVIHSTRSKVLEGPPGPAGR
jgi:hypothetical protein